MNKRTEKIGFISGIVTIVIMLVLARYGYVEPSPTVANVYSANAYWNFTLLEMFIGTFLLWPVVWLVIYKKKTRIRNKILFNETQIIALAETSLILFAFAFISSWLIARKLNEFISAFKKLGVIFIACAIIKSVFVVTGDSLILREIPASASVFWLLSVGGGLWLSSSHINSKLTRE